MAVKLMLTKDTVLQFMDKHIEKGASIPQAAQAAMAKFSTPEYLASAMEILGYRAFAELYSYERVRKPRMAAIGSNGGYYPEDYDPKRSSTIVDRNKDVYYLYWTYGIGKMKIVGEMTKADWAMSAEYYSREAKKLNSRAVISRRFVMAMGGKGVTRIQLTRAEVLKCLSG